MSSFERFRLNNYFLLVFLVLLFNTIIFTSLNGTIQDGSSSYISEGDGNNDLPHKRLLPSKSPTISNNSFMGIGDNLPARLSYVRNQSLINNSTQNPYLEINNQVGGLNMSNFQLKFSNLSTSGKYVKFENRNDGSLDFKGAGHFYSAAVSIPNSCYLSNFSMFLQYWGGDGNHESDFEFWVYNATWNSTRHEFQPDSRIDDDSYENYFNLTALGGSQPAKWYQANYTNFLLNISHTANNTFLFIFRSWHFRDNPRPSAFIYYADEELSNAPYQYRSYYQEGSAGNFTRLAGKNLMLKVNFLPLNKHPTPEEINLTVFNNPINNSGTYSNSTLFSLNDEFIRIPVSSPWFAEVIYNCSFQGNFYKTTYTSNHFNATINTGVVWNSTLSINAFPTDSAVVNKSLTLQKSIHWILVNVYLNSEAISMVNIIAEDKEIHLNSIENGFFSLLYTQYDCVQTVTLKRSSNLITWQDIGSNAYFTDYINVTASVNCSFGETYLQVRSSALDVDIAKNYTESVVQFPVWQPFLNTTAFANNTQLYLQIMISNGTMAGIKTTSFTVVFSNIDSDVTNSNQEVMKEEIAYYQFSINNTLNNQPLQIEEFTIQINSSLTQWETLVKDFHFFIHEESIGIYNISISTNRDIFKASYYFINFTFTTTYYNSLTVSEFLMVNERTHKVNILGCSNDERIFNIGEQAKYYVLLNDTENGEGVEDASFLLKSNLTGTIELIDGSSYSINDRNDGNYTITIYTDLLYSQESFKNITIELYAWKPYYYSITKENDSLNIINSTHLTHLSILSNSSNLFEFGTTPWIALQFTDNLTKTNITGADFTIIDEVLGALSKNTFNIYEKSEYYNITFEVLNFEPGEYHLTILAEERISGLIHYESASSLFNFTVNLYPSNLTIPQDYLDLQIYQDGTLEMIVIAKDLYRQIDILDAEIKMKIEGVLEYSELFNPVSQSFGWYRGFLPFEGIEPGIYNITLEMKADGYLPSNTESKITVLEKKETNIQFLTQIKDILSWGDILRCEIRLKTSSKSLPSKLLIFQVIETYQNGETEIKSFEIETDKNGIAVFTYEIPEISNVEITAIFEGSTEYNKSELLLGNLDILSQTEKLVLDSFPFIGLLAALSLIVIGYKVRKSKELKKKHAKWKSVEDIYQDVMSIEYFLVVHKRSGRMIIEEDFGETSLDGNLLGGFLQAITTFIYGLKEKKSSTDHMGGFTFDYEDYKILLQNGKFVRIALILNSAPTDPLKNELGQFIHRFEDEYYQYLEDFNGILTPFRDYHKLATESFKLSLKKPHIIKKKVPIGDYDEVQSKIISLSQTFQLLTGKNFSILELRKYLLDALKEYSSEEITAKLLDLINKGILIPVFV